uniref:non-specific serine/threonine protein kinase n=1 Tax=Kalanchoe fedtschenkoi TaxID=63787 RepID=A0A7N0UAE7_KALFE
MTRRRRSFRFQFPVLLNLIAAVAAATLLVNFVDAIGSGGTLAISYGSRTVCGIVAGEATQRIACYRGSGEYIAVAPNVSFSSIAGGESSFCGIRSGGYSLLCWNAASANFTVRRVYFNVTVLLENLTYGDDQVCATVVGTGEARCWRGGIRWANTPSAEERFGALSSGLGFTCGILMSSGHVRCWGENPIAGEIESQFGNSSLISIVAGGSHVCGLNETRHLLCKGSNSSAQLGFSAGLDDQYSSLALGLNHTCAVRTSNGSVVCWGGRGEFLSNVTVRSSFESIAAATDFTCGLLSSNYSVHCWGPGWVEGNRTTSVLPLPRTLPGPCVSNVSLCSQCGIYDLSAELCPGSGSVCKPTPCDGIVIRPAPPSLQPSPPPVSPPPGSPSRGLRRGLLAFAVVGSVGIFAGICTVVYCLYTGICCGHKKVHNSVQPTIAAAGRNSNSGSTPPSRSSTLRRQCSRAMRRQRSGTSSKHADRAEEFLFNELSAATNDFSLENKIGSGSFGVVYKGKLSDGREVAIKRGETKSKSWKFQEKETAFDSELAFLSRLHHKHLVKLIGYCEENDERLLVYEYMKNGALYDHLHSKDNVEKGSSVVNSWKVRIGIALDAARGIEYLHNYAVPSIIHRDIKSSNILLDANWTARVSDFGLSLLGSDSDQEQRPMKAAGTVGYIDPEYYSLNVLTAKSDVYGFGVVLLELLTGKRAIFRTGDSSAPISVVDFTVPAIMAGEVSKVLDPRVGRPELNESEAVELVAYTAMHCVNLEGKDRPTMSDIVANLERALILCEDSHGSISNDSIVSL